jgi:tetratricopeptide (TPR) repeat protein
LDAAEKIEEVQREIDIAEVYYRLALIEHGNLEAFDIARSHLDLALAALREAPDSVLSDRELELRRAISGLEIDIQEQRSIAHDTLYGVFPLLRLLKKSLFSDPEAGGTFELVDDPDVVAVTRAAERMASTFVETKVTKPQLRVVITSEPSRPDLENEVLYVLNGFPNFSVITKRSFSEALKKHQIENLEAGHLDAKVLEDLAAASGVRELLWTRIVEGPASFDDYLYMIEARDFVSGNDEPRLLMRSYGLCRDRRDQQWSVLFAHLALLSIAVLAMAWANAGQDPPRPLTPGRVALLAFVGFTLGRIYPWMVLPLVGAMTPQPETLAILSFWWPCALGVVLFGGPVMIMRIARQRFGLGFVPVGLDPALTCSMVLGVVAYLSVPLFLLVGARGSIALGSVAVVGCAAVVAFSAGIARNGSIGRAGWALVMMMLLGVLGAHLKAVPLVLLAVGAMLYTGSSLRAKTKAKPPKIDAEIEPAADPVVEPPGGPKSLEEIIAAAEHPGYVELDWYRDVHEMSKPFFAKGACTWVALVGERGRGKTATAESLISRAAGESPNMIRLDIECHKPIGEEVPYDSIRIALAEYFRVDFLTEDPDPKLAGVDGWLDDVFDSVVPFAGILFPPKDERSLQATSREEVNIAVAKTLRHLATQNGLVLFIDDAQWMDGASQDLVNHLVRRGLPGGEKLPVFGVVTSRTLDGVEKIGIPETSIFEIEETDTKDKITILRSALGFTADLAAEVVEGVEGCAIEGDNLFWLYHVAAHLAREGEIEAFEDGVRRSSRLASDQPLSVPREFRGAILQILEKWPQYRHVLECAACYGREFDAGVLAHSLDTPPLEMLKELHSIERDTGLIFDVRDTDDVFAFRSSFLLETIRQNLGITGLEAGGSEIPQIIREYHARIASDLEGRLASNPGLVYEVANHFLMAGKKHANTAKMHCLDAARSAAGVFDHDTARKYVGHAKRAAEMIGAGAEARTELLLETLRIEAMVAHISQVDVLKTAERLYEAATTNGEVPIDIWILAARACYEAGGPDARQQWFAKSVELAERGLQLTSDPVEKAEFEQFIGISLPRSESERRREHLMTAMSALDGYPDEDLRAQALRGRVANSLALEMSKTGDPKDRERAKELFELSLTIKGRRELRDLKGQAITHGCLGGFYYFCDPPDVTAARHHLELDLEISEEIGDRLGQTKSLSLLGACDLAETNSDSAVRRYREAEATAPDDVNKLFALCGLIQSLIQDANIEGAHEAGGRLLSCVSSLVASNEKFPQQVVLGVVSLEQIADADWARSLSELVREAGE